MLCSALSASLVEVSTASEALPAKGCFTSTVVIRLAKLRPSRTLIWGENQGLDSAATQHSKVPTELRPMLNRCEKRIGYKFKDKTLLWSALIHASGADSRLASNERLEFLGDAILGAVVCEMLYHRYPEYLEGELTRIKSVVVSRRTCAKVSRMLGLEEFLIVGKGMEANSTVPRSLLADVFESLVAAIHLDGGAEKVRNFIEGNLLTEIELVATGAMGENYKSQLQQLAQREFGNTPTYRMLEQKGPDHSKCFKVSAQIGGRSFEPAWGPNKKEAEQRAARNALSALAKQPSATPSE